MIGEANGVYGALYGTLFTWGMTALGAAVVFAIPRSWSQQRQRSLLDSSFGFAAGVMIAASFWSLLAPAIELAETSGIYGAFPMLPVITGFLGGAAFVHLADYFLTQFGVSKAFGLQTASSGSNESKHDKAKAQKSWRRMILLVIAIIVHNYPEGLAVGVAFGGALPLSKAKALAVGIGLQNLPEGIAVSLPLYQAGMPSWKAFFIGQLSGMVEPLGGVFGAFAVLIAEPVLPYAMAFAAGAMIFVVIDDVLPEVQNEGNIRLISWAAIAGFVVMMTMDCTLG